MFERKKVLIYEVNNIHKKILKKQSNDEYEFFFHNNPDTILGLDFSEYLSVLVFISTSRDMLNTIYILTKTKRYVLCSSCKEINDVLRKIDSIHYLDIELKRKESIQAILEKIKEMEVL